MKSIKIQCISVCRIMFPNNQYLLIKNRRYEKKGQIYYGPLGGGIEATESGIRHLQSKFNATDFKSESPLDLRFTLQDSSKLNDFRKWFESGKDREIDPNREVYEELKLENPIVYSL